MEEVIDTDIATMRVSTISTTRALTETSLFSDLTSDGELGERDSLGTSMVSSIKFPK